MLGRAWAERRADVLLGSIPPVDWPDVWGAADNGPLPMTDVDPRDLHTLSLMAEHAAAERWRELLKIHRADEDAEDEEQESEAFAVHLLEQLSSDLPRGLVARRDGERVYIEELATGRETTVDSLAHAWRVVAEWSEHTRPA